MTIMQRERSSTMPTDQMVDAAIAFCASKAFAGDTAHARQALRQGRCDVCDYLRYSLAKQIGDYLGQMDPTIRAVYVFEAEPAEIEGSLPCRRTGESGISLIAWVDRKTAALGALVAALEADLARGRHGIGCASATPGCYFLDVHMVDDADVRERRGYGALVNGLYVRPVEVWTRAD